MPLDVLMETSEYKLKLLSSKWEGPIVIYISNEHFGDAGEQMKAGIERKTSVPFTFCELVVNDWDKYLSPWESNVSLHGRVFGGKANWLLSNIEENVIPKLREYNQESEIYIAGYSLAGLFSLWCLYESDVFDGAACCSGSVWYPGWKEYAEQHQLQRSSSVYLSLGKKEKKTKHPLMRTVEENMLHQYEILKRDKNVDMLQMDWHDGGHFDNINDRMEMGIYWLIA